MTSKLIEESSVCLDDDYDYFTCPFSFDNNSHFLMCSIYEPSFRFNEAFYSLNKDNSGESIHIDTPNDCNSEESKENIERKIGNKRGRISKQENSQKKPHNKYKVDNQVRTIQVHYFKFLIKFLNTIFSALNLDYSLKDLSYQYKQKTTKEYRIQLEQKTIRQILLETPISKKKMNIDIDYNKNIIKKIEEKDQYLFNILDKNFLYFFETIFFKNLKTINLSLFNCIDKEINLNKNVNMFVDIFDEEDEIYKQKMEKTAKKYFITNCNF